MIYRCESAATATYLELARECAMKADWWIKAADVKSKEELFQLVVMEHFRGNLPSDMQYEVIK